MSMRSCIATCCLIVVVLAGLPAAAVSWVTAEGTVHSKWTSGGALYLKIERPDGSKVAADCMFTDQILFDCQAAAIGSQAQGRARCENGVCTWTEFSPDIGGFNSDKTIEPPLIQSVSDVHAEGWVHSMWTTVSGVHYLKIVRADGSKVAADCEHTDCILNECINSTVGMNAAGYARCQDGYCTWIAFGTDYIGPPGCH